MTIQEAVMFSIGRYCNLRRILTQMRCHRMKIIKLSSLELRHLRKQFLTVPPPPLAIQLPLSQLLLCSPHKSLVFLQTNRAFRAEGMRIVDPSGKPISRPRSHNVRCAPRRRPKTPQYPRGETCSSTAEDLQLL